MVDLAFVIAGSEATGGAGIQVDLKTFQQMGVYGVGALTCIVAFDPGNGWAHRFHPVEPGIIAEQIEAALAAHEPPVVKIGMLGTPSTIEVVEKALAGQAFRHVVVDPVLICKGQEPGAALDTDTALRERILPLATVVTPNNFETRTLAGVDSLDTVADLEEAGRLILKSGPSAVIVKGGVDFPGPDAIDVLVQRLDGGAVDVRVFSVPKIGEERVSGAGCTFAAAITAGLAKGWSVPDAVATAKKHVTEGIMARVSARTPFTTVWQGAFGPDQ
ncbi:MAG: hydroxymethylpyrimidine/phosphomethylpyrimidine kinase [Micrococcales bacterium]|nr:hydroxymethylpyrimidine/phosphomethylpyrimidine kinase [Micrococcales bacterium]